MSIKTISEELTTSGKIKEKTCLYIVEGMSRDDDVRESRDEG